MRIPLNLIQFYIGLPLLVFLSVRSFLSNRRSPNTTTLLVGVTTGLYAVSYASQIIPIFFTENSTVLSLGTIVAVFFESLALFFVWQIVFRIYLSNSVSMRRAASVLIGIAATAVAYVGIQAAFIQPTTLQQVGGIWNINIPYPFSQRLLSAFLYSGLLLIAGNFYMQSRQINKAPQKILLVGFSLGLTLISLFFFAQPFFGAEIFANNSGLYILMGVGFIGGGLILSLIWRDNQ